MIPQPVLSLIFLQVPGLSIDVPEVGRLEAYVWEASPAEVILLILATTAGLWGVLLGILRVLRPEKPARVYPRELHIRPQEGGWNLNEPAAGAGASPEWWRQPNVIAGIAALVLVAVLIVSLNGRKSQAKKQLQDTVIELMKKNGWERLSLNQVRQLLGWKEGSRYDQIALGVKSAKEEEGTHLELVVFGDNRLGYKLHEPDSVSCAVRRSVCDTLQSCGREIIDKYRALYGNDSAHVISFDAINYILAKKYPVPLLLATFNAYPTVFDTLHVYQRQPLCCPPLIDDGRVVAIRIHPRQWETYQDQCPLDYHQLKLSQHSRDSAKCRRIKALTEWSLRKMGPLRPKPVTRSGPAGKKA